MSKTKIIVVLSICALILLTILQLRANNNVEVSSLSKQNVIVTTKYKMVAIPSSSENEDDDEIAAATTIISGGTFIHSSRFITLDPIPKYLHFLDAATVVAASNGKNNKPSNPWNLLLNSKDDDGESLPSRFVGSNKDEANEIVKVKDDSCLRDQMSEAYPEYLEVGASSTVQSDSAISSLRFSCAARASEPTDFIHCEPKKNQNENNNNNNNKQRSIATESTIMVDVPMLEQKQRVYQSGKNEKNSDGSSSAWPSSLRAANVSLLPFPYSICRTIADQFPQSDNKKKSSKDKQGLNDISLNHNNNNQKQHVVNDHALLTGINLALVSQIKFNFLKNSRGPFNCILGISELVLDWAPPSSSSAALKSMKKNHIVIRIANTNNNNNNNFCKISVQVFSVDHHRNRCFSRNVELPREQFDLKPHQFYPPAFHVAKGNAGREILTYSIEAGGLGSLDLFTSSDSRFSSFPPVSNTTTNNNNNVNCGRVLDQNFFKSLPPRHKKPNDQQEEISGLARQSSLRCETGPYMGYTNIVQSFVTCVVLARLCHRRVLEFPLKLHHSTFDQLFDLDLMAKRIEERFGLAVKLYAPGGLSRDGGVDEPLIGADRPGSPNYLDQFMGFCEGRPWSTVYVGDVWATRMNIASGNFHVEFLNSIFAPSKFILSYADVILNKFGRRYYHYSDSRHPHDEGDGKDETSSIQQHSRSSKAATAAADRHHPWVALHLRFEDDAVNLNTKSNLADDERMKQQEAAMASAAEKAAKLREYVERVYPGYPVYYAAGSLHKNVRAKLPLYSDEVQLVLQQRAATYNHEDEAKSFEKLLNRRQRSNSNNNGDEDDVPSKAHRKFSKKNIPSNGKVLWLSKDDFFPRYISGARRPWKRTYQGRYFNGQPVTVTNATGSAIDIHVLLHSPVAIVAEFSSFGEAVAAARCARGWPVWMYDAQGGSVRAVDCEHPILFRRPLQERIRSQIAAMHAGVGDAREAIAKKVEEEVEKIFAGDKNLKNRKKKK